jgi:DNA-binding NarL/FixJ family response regulator
MVETNSVSVALQHQNRLVREMLAGHLMREPGISLAGTAQSGPELIQLCNLRRPSVAVFELDAPRWSNERLVSLLTQSSRHLRMIGVHDSLSASYIIRAYEAGISALVSYSSGLETLLDAIRNPSLPVETARAKREDGNTLTERELQVLYLITAGYSPKQVATELEISPHTVENHKQRIFAKLDVHNQAHAAASAARLGLMPRTVPLAPKNPKAVAKRRRRVGVALRDPAGRLALRIQRLLADQSIPLVSGPMQDRSRPGGRSPDGSYVDGSYVDKSLLDGSSLDGSSLDGSIPDGRPDGPVLDGDGGTARGETDGQRLGHPGVEHDVVVTVMVDPARYERPAEPGRRAELVVVTSHELSNPEVTQALAAGVTTVPASRVDDLLVPAIRAAAQGYTLVSANQLRTVLGPSGAGGGGGASGWQRWELSLTPREREILMAICRGQATKQTARQLGISVRTVENLQSNLFRKLRVHSRAAAVAAAHDLGLLES